MIKKILLFIETGGGGGAESVVVTLAKLLKTKDIDVVVASLREGWLSETLRESNISYKNINSNKSLDFSLPFKIARLAKAEKCSLIHSHLLDANFYCSIASLISGIPLICTEHGDVHHTKPRKFLKFKIKLISFLSKNITTVSHYTKQRLLELGCDQRNVSVIGNPILFEEIQTNQRDSIRQELQIPNNSDQHWLWIQIANLRKVKDQSTLIKAFASLKSEKHTLLILGEGEERKNLESLIKYYKLENQVKLLGFKKNVNEYLSAADGFILSSLSEALPMSILEAGCSKKLVIASDVGGIQDVIEDGVTGFLYQAGDYQALANLMKKTIVGDLPVNLVRENLFERVKENYSSEVIIEKLLELYKSIAK